jgi:Ni/Co efflux regulator RcnB
MSWGIAAKPSLSTCLAVRRLRTTFNQGSADVLHITDNGDVAEVRERACRNETMKKLMTGALTALLMASAAAPALAQQGGYPDGDPRNSGGRGRYGAAVNRNPEQPRDQAPPPQAQPPQAAPSEQRRGDRDWNRGDDGRRGDERARENRGDRGSGDRGDRGARNWDQPRDAGRDWDRNRRDGRDRNWTDDRGRNRDWYRERAWRGQGRDWNRERPRYERRYYPPVYHSQRRYRGPAWNPPVGFYSRSWVFGDVLPRGWYGSDYYIDWWSYGLPIPPVGYEWVRMGDDAVMVDEFSGRVVQVVPNLFW